ncbi:hypothetical protein PFISCL1PPCAC_8110, partial [Pristionchus fissidentatus]
ASSEASPLPPATSPSVPDAPTPVTGETNPTGTQTQEGGITGTQSKEGGPTDDKEPVSFTDRDATKAGGIGQMKKKKKKKSKKKKTAKYKYTTDRFESNLFLMRLEGTLFCGGIMAGIILLVTNFLIVLIVGAFTGFNFGHVF